MGTDGTDQKKQELLRRLEQGVQDVFSSERFKAYLSTAAKFHNYSSRNTLLIALQNPNARRVAGFNTWKRLHRFVKRGEKAISILAPVKVNVRQKVPVNNADGTIQYHADGSTVTEDVVKPILRFKTVNVFDISQTDGEPLPTICNPLQGGVANYETLFSALKAAAAPYTVRFQSLPGGIHGLCDPKAKQILLDYSMSDLQTIKTLCHELTHSKLHGGAGIPKPQAEIEAEATAYMVADHLGLDTSEYSFDYIASWAQGVEPENLLATLEGIQGQAHELINHVDAALDALQMEKAAPQQVCLPNRLLAAKAEAERKNAELPEKEVTYLEPSNHMGGAGNVSRNAGLSGRAAGTDLAGQHG